MSANTVTNTARFIPDMTSADTDDVTNVAAGMYKLKAISQSFITYMLFEFTLKLFYINFTFYFISVPRWRNAISDVKKDMGELKNDTAELKKEMEELGDIVTGDIKW